MQVAQKAAAEENAALLSSSLEEAKTELSAAKCTAAEQEEALRLQLGTATSNAADLSSQLEEKMSLFQKLEEDLRSVETQKVCSLFSLVYSLKALLSKASFLFLLFLPLCNIILTRFLFVRLFSPYLQDAYAKDLEESSTLAASLKSSLETITKEAATAAAKVAELEVRNKHGLCFCLAFI